MLIQTIILCSLAFANAKDANVLMTEVFAIALDPPMFNWTYEGIKDQFVYQASLLDAPDLPSWINYIYSEQHRSGFLYGVPPKVIDNIPLEIVALNKKTYETRVENLNIVISEKLNSAKYEVHLKIDNLNVEDMFDVVRMESLKNVFRKELWKNSAFDLYVTLLNSAVELGARKPPNPREGEGVVIRLGSETAFSTELIELQKEVTPLSNLPSCPRNFKKTSVERYFREAGFVLDWCSFHLVDNNNSAMHRTNELVKDDYYMHGDVWQSISKFDVPQRSYYNELMVSLLVPVLILIILGLFLSFLLCFHHDELEDEESEIYFHNLFHICMDYYYDHYIYKRASHIYDMTSDQISYSETIHRPSESIRSFNRETTLSPDLCSHSNSPNSTMNRGVHCRPSPPPYVKPRGTPDL
ncbi:epsilon-sarcoglycan isoform X1 [Diorhabda sublineata]|uniref:epsilon-sarcoglycan isoform X1 n=1 Tax=Diorhabda sublineata TaxID=1163346 RepID=UPI0024E0C6F2|nr:epsilon-sarcoglycan isoform X1 [Diorhabda sublineata]